MLIGNYHLTPSTKRPFLDKEFVVRNTKILKTVKRPFSA
jgi:hypothetical protein